MPDPAATLIAPAQVPIAPRNAPCDRWFGEDEIAHWSAPVAAPVPCRVRRNAVLIHEGARAEHLYIVLAGEFKASRTSEDGYEQVLDFVAAPDILGLDGLSGGRSLVTVQALQDATVRAIPIADLRALRAANEVFDAHLQEALSAQWARMRDMAWLMAALGADRRTARFVLVLSRRMAEHGMSPRRLLLRMSRRDIAAHIGLAHESISRALTALAEAGYLRVYVREIEILDPDGLARLASSTRGQALEPVRAARRTVPASRGAVDAAACMFH